MSQQDPNFFIGVDVGTGSARACIVDQNGTLLGSSFHETQTWQSSRHCYEQSTRDIWNSVCTSIRNVIQSSGVPTHHIRSIAFAATCSLAVFDYRDNTPISVVLSNDVGCVDENIDHNVMLWMHSAAEVEAETINSTRHSVLRHLGGAVSPLMALAKVLWLKKNMPVDTFSRCRFFDLHDALGHMATGGRISMCGPGGCHLSGGSLGFGIDGTIKGWDSKLLEQIGLELLYLEDFKQVGGVCEHGKPIPIGTPIGVLCAQAAQDLGLSRDVIVSSGIIDCYAGWIGTIGTQSASSDLVFNMPVHQRLALVAGTSACHILASDQDRFVKGVWGPYHDFLLPNSFTIVGGQSAAGHLLQHVLKTHPSFVEAESHAQESDQTIFEYLDAHLEASRVKTNAPNAAHLARHVFFYGDHFGNRSPIADPKMTGAIVGLTDDTSIDNLAIMYYAVLEFLALQTKHIISTMQKSGHNVGAIFMSGSLCHNQAFVDLLSTACSLPVILAEYPHSAGCYGSALLAAAAAGTVRHPRNQLRGDLGSIISRMSRVGKVSTPIKDHYMARLLDVKYTIFLDQVNAQQRYRKLIDTMLIDMSEEAGLKLTASF